MSFSEVVIAMAPFAVIADLVILYLIATKLRGKPLPLWTPKPINRYISKRIDRSDYVKGWP